MRIIEPSATIITPFQRDPILRLIECAGRTCYKSEGHMSESSAPEFVKRLTQQYKHESVLEHYNVSVRFIVDRGVSHELVRHRLCAFSQESTRFCNYSHDKFENSITVIKPCFWDKDSTAYHVWREACLHAERQYFNLLDEGATAQEARAVLPNSLKTELVVTTNMREWKHIFKMRCAKNAHPQMRQVMVPLFETFKTLLPEIYGDVVI